MSQRVPFDGLHVSGVTAFPFRGVVGEGRWGTVPPLAINHPSALSGDLPRSLTSALPMAGSLSRATTQAHGSTFSIRSPRGCFCTEGTLPIDISLAGSEIVCTFVA